MTRPSRNTTNSPSPIPIGELFLFALTLLVPLAQLARAQDLEMPFVVLWVPPIRFSPRFLSTSPPTGLSQRRMRFNFGHRRTITATRVLVYINTQTLLIPKPETLHCNHSQTQTPTSWRTLGPAFTHSSYLGLDPNTCSSLNLTLT